MEKHEQKHCPRCSAIFTCRTGDVINCQCNTVNLSEDTARFLSITYFDCLCKGCLQELNEKVTAANRYRFPTQKEMFMEGLHFYKEGENWVFTELYHILKGYCCRNGCRHCPYGFKETS